MPYSRRTGRRYTAGSQATWAGWEPRVCVVCGGRTTLREASMHSRHGGPGGTPASVHVRCGGMAAIRETPA